MDKPAFEQFPAFEEFTDYVCKKIMSTRKKAEVKEELWSHLMDIYEQNRATGMQHTDAQKNAIEHMGDRQRLQYRMAQLYSISPPDYMRSSLNFLIFGILFSHVHLNFFAGADQIFAFFGEMLVLYALFKLREVSSKIKTAFYIYPLSLLLGITAGFCAQYWIDGTIAVSVLQILTYILQAVFYGFLFAGLHAACKSVQTEGEKEPHLGFCCFLMLSILGFFIAVIAQNDLNEDLSLFAYIFIGEILIILFGLRRAKRILIHSEPEFPLEKPLQKQDKLLYSALVMLFLALPFLGMYFAAARQPETTVYSPVDTAESVQTVQEARAHMLSLGFPEEYLADLPDSEVLKYQNATYMAVPEYPDDKNSHPHADGSELQTYFFYIPSPDFDGSDETDISAVHHADYIRILYRLSNLEAQKRHYRDGLYMMPNARNLYTLNESDATPQMIGLTFLVLSDYNGKTLSSEPIAIQKGETLGARTYSGAEFSVPQGSANQRVYFAQTYGCTTGNWITNTYVSGYYIHKELPIYPSFSNTLFAADNAFYGGMFRASDPSYAMYDGSKNLIISPKYFGRPEPVFEADTEEISDTDL